jgi:hypothetical protein
LKENLKKIYKFPFKRSLPNTLDFLIKKLSLSDDWAWIVWSLAHASKLKDTTTTCSYLQAFTVNYFLNNN